jgi:hypothetical protein
MPRYQKWLVVWQAFVTGFMTLTAGASLADIVGQRLAALLALLAAAANAGTLTYTASMRLESTASTPPTPIGPRG